MTEMASTDFTQIPPPAPKPRPVQLQSSWFKGKKALMWNLGVFGSLFALGLDPTPAAGGGWEELLRYALTQGGLFGICVILIYLRQQEVKARDAASSARHDENVTRISVLTEIAARSASASEQNASGLREQAAATARLANAVERIAAVK